MNLLFHKIDQRLQLLVKLHLRKYELMKDVAIFLQTEMLYHISKKTLLFQAHAVNCMKRGTHKSLDTNISSVYVRFKACCTFFHLDVSKTFMHVDSTSVQYDMQVG